VLADVALDKLQQNIGHVLALGGRGRLEGVVQPAYLRSLLRAEIQNDMAAPVFIRKRSFGLQIL
jgi:hypothetical protein